MGTDHLGADERGAMRRHLYFYTHIPQPFEAAATLLAGSPTGWLPEPATARDGGWEVQLRAEGALPERVAERSAVVVAGDPLVDTDRLLLPLSWQATTKEQLFPVFAGDLGLDALDGVGCHLSLMGTYRPPLSVVGGAGDALLGHRVAEAVVRRFVLDVAQRIGAALAV
jgi:hypothetical protein